MQYQPSKNIELKINAPNRNQILLVKALQPIQPHVSQDRKSNEVGAEQIHCAYTGTSRSGTSALDLKLHIKRLLS